MIQIKNPCDANWQEMTPAQSGKYCGACEKVVVDFSNMNDDEIKNYFATYKEQKTCGRFLDSQLERPLVVPSQTRFNTFLNHLNKIPIARTVVFFLTSASMWISSCVKNNNDDMTTRDTTTVIKNNNINLIDDTSAVIKQQNNEPLIKIYSNEIVTGEVTLQQTTKMLPPQVLMGDICVSPDEHDTLAVTIPATYPDTKDTVVDMIMGKVKLVDTISQKIKRKK